MDDWLKENEPAQGVASEMAGEYLASIGKTDLTAFTDDEWKTLIYVIIKAFIQNMIPF